MSALRLTNPSAMRAGDSPSAGVQRACRYGHNPALPQRYHAGFVTAGRSS